MTTINILTKIIFIALVISIVILVLLFKSHSDLSKDNEKLKVNNKTLIKELNEQAAIAKDYEKRINSLHELDTKHTTELTNAKVEIDKLRIVAERNPERVYIRAFCPKNKTNSTSGMDDEITARPTDSAIRNNWILRNRIAECNQMILGLQDYIKAECVTQNLD